MSGIYGYETYGELLSALRKDLQLDAKTDILAGTILEAAKNDGIKLGTATLTWPGATPRSNLLTVAHGLGTSRPPAGLALVEVVPAAAAFSAYPVVGQVSDATNIYIAAQSTTGNPAAASTQSVVWIAFA